MRYGALAFARRPGVFAVLVGVRLAAGLLAAGALMPAGGADHASSAAPNDPLFRHQGGPRQIQAEQTGTAAAARER